MMHRDIAHVRPELARRSRRRERRRDPVPNSGPGTILSRKIGRLGGRQCQSCKTVERLMDNWGLKCQDKIEYLVALIHHNATENDSLLGRLSKYAPEKPVKAVVRHLIQESINEWRDKENG